MSIKETVRRTLENLRTTIAHHEHAYRVLLEPEITDSQFDALKAQLVELETRHPELAQQELFIDRSSEVDNEEGSRIPMLSLNHTTQLHVVHSAFAQVLQEPGPAPVTVEPKLDGVALSLVYQDGRLVAARTRGDESNGRGVLENVRMMRGVPHRLQGEILGRIEIRGEGVIYRANFDDYNNLAELSRQRAYSNPRAMAAAALRVQDPQVSYSMKLNFMAYEVLGKDFTLDTEALYWLSQCGFTIVPHTVVYDLTELDAAIAKIAELREVYSYEIDGAVIKYNVLTWRMKAGYGVHHPYWAMAFKYPSREAFSPITGVVFQTSRAGTVTPVVKVVPVDLGGVMVSSVTSHNPATLTRMQLRVGDIAIIRLANDVIPYLVKANMAGNGPIIKPTTECPSCTTALISRGGSGLCCPNTLTCPAQIVGTLSHFCGRRGMDIHGLGPGRIEKLYLAGVIREPIDLFLMTGPQIKEALDLSDIVVNQILTAIAVAKFTTMPRFLTALGIEGVGNTLAVRLAKICRYDLIELLDASEKLLCTVDGINVERARSIKAFLIANRAALVALVEKGIQWPKVNPMPTEVAQPLEGLTVVITGGVVSQCKRIDRTQVTAYYRDLGATVSTFVTPKTSALIIGYKPTMAKVVRARTLGVPVIGVDDFQTKWQLPPIPPN